MSTFKNLDSQSDLKALNLFLVGGGSRIGKYMTYFSLLGAQRSQIFKLAVLLIMCKSVSFNANINNIAK